MNTLSNWQMKNDMGEKVRKCIEIRIPDDEKEDKRTGRSDEEVRREDKIIL